MDSDVLVERIKQIDRLIEAGDIWQGWYELNSLASLNPDLGDGWMAIAWLAGRAGDDDLAADAAIRAVGSSRSDPRRQMVLLQFLALANRVEDAQRLAATLLESRSGESELQKFAGILAARAGDLTLARERLRRALALAPEDGLAYEQLAHVGGLLDSEYDRLRRLAAAAGRSEEGAARLYALGKAASDRGEIAEALAAIEGGAAIMRTLAPHDPAPMEAYLGRLRTNFATVPEGSSTDGPILILGAPRSGTTLVEQALSAHSRIGATGESRLLRLAMQPLRNLESADLEAFRAGRDDEAMAKAWSSIGRTYDRLLARRIGEGLRATDKQLGNFFFVGALARAHPGMKVVYCRRDPMDVAWSCWRLRLQGNAWSHDQEQIARYLQSYDGLMSHWRDLLGPDRFLDLDYEDLVRDPAPVIDRLLAFAGLVPEEACHRPHLAKAPVATASLAQVREPIHRRAIGQWKPYASGLAPLRAAFGH